MIKRTVKSRIKVKKSISKKIKGTAERPRLCVYKSLDQIYVQFIDDNAHKTLFQVSSLNKDVKAKLEGLKGKVSKSKLIGKLAAEKAKENNLTSGVFDRNGFRYHGRIKALADGLRENGFNV